MTTVSTPRMGAPEWGMLVLLSLIWGGSFLFARIAVQEVAPMTLVFYRVALAALTLNIVLLVRNAFIFGDAKLWIAFAGMGVLNNIIPFGLIFYGQQEIGAGLAAIVNAMTPIWTALIAHFRTLDEKMSAGKAAGIALGFAGVGVLIGSAALEGLAASAWAQIAVLGATLSYGFAGVFGKRFAKVSPLQTARGQLSASTVLMVPVFLLFDGVPAFHLPSPAAIWSIVLLAILCTAFAYLLFFVILARAGSVNVSLVTFLVPLSAIVLGIIFLDETLAFRHVAGLAIIMTGLIVIDGRLFQRRT